MDRSRGLRRRPCAFAATAPPDQDWKVTGPAAPKLKEFDERIRDFMRNQGVSAGQVAIWFQGKPALNHGYTNGDHPRIGPDSLFRLASCSKIFTCAAIHALHSSGKLDMDSKVFPMLGIHAPAVPSDKPPKRINEITVQNHVAL